MLVKKKNVVLTIDEKELQAYKLRGFVVIEEPEEPEELEEAAGK